MIVVQDFERKSRLTNKHEIYLQKFLKAQQIFALSSSFTFKQFRYTVSVYLSQKN